MTKLLLSGATGRMGKAISALCTQYGFEVVAGIDVNTAEKTPFPLYSSYALCREEAQVLADFSRPAHLKQTLRCAMDRQVPLLVGTTGLEAAHERMINEAAAEIPLLQSANFSLGIQALLRLAQQAKSFLPDFDIEIIERHHAQKADSPGGTALMLYTAVAQSQTQPVYGRHAALQKRTQQEIGLHAVRGGTLCGIHETGFYGQGEHLQLIHTAESRDVFAHGALRCLQWLISQKPGRYDMKDIFS